MKLVIAGAANWKSPFVERLKRTDDPRVVFLGGVYTPGHIKELHCHCHAYVHGNEVGGTNPALLKALGYGNCVLALDVSYNAEVVAGAGILYRKDPADLAAKLQRVIDHPEEAREFRLRACAGSRRRTLGHDHRRLRAALPEHPVGALRGAARVGCRPVKGRA